MTTATAEQQKKSLRGATLREKIRVDPEWFMRRCLGADPWEKQVEIAKAMFRSNRVGVRGCVASSKTNAISMAALAWLYAWPDARVFTFAPSYRQVGTNLWAEIKSRYAQAEANGVPLGGKLFAGTELKLSDTCYMKGFSTKEPAMLHGIHGPHDLIILDDAHGIPRELTDELENMMAGGQTHIIMSFNPVVTTGETYDCTHSMADLWENIKISFWDTPNSKAKIVDGVVVAGRFIAGMLLPETVKTWARKYGPNSNFYKSKVDAEYPSQEPDTLIPMHWIELAMDREVPTVGERLTVGCDVAWEGDDDSVIAPMRGRKVEALEVYHGQDPMQIADKLDVHLVAPDAFGCVDAIGIGAGVFSREAQRKRNVVAVVVSEEAVGKFEDKEAKEHFFNLRAQTAWMLREALDPSNPEAISLPKDLELQAQMSAIKYKTNEKNGKIQLESKKDLKKRTGWSPDRFDAVMLANWGRHKLAGVEAVKAWANAAAATPAAAMQSETDAGLSIDDGDGEHIDLGQSMTLAGLGSMDD